MKEICIVCIQHKRYCTLVRSEFRKGKQEAKTTVLGRKKNECFTCLNCRQCDLMMKEEYYIHPVSGQKCGIKGFHTWQSAYVFYILMCPCNLIYVGETTQRSKTEFPSTAALWGTSNQSCRYPRFLLNRNIEIQICSL